MLKIFREEEVLVQNGNVIDAKNFYLYDLFPLNLSKRNEIVGRIDPDRLKRSKEAGAFCEMRRAGSLLSNKLRATSSCAGFRRWHGRKACPREPNRCVVACDCVLLSLSRT